MAQIEGLQVNIQGNVDGLKKAATEATNQLGGIAKAADAASKNISAQLDNAASTIESSYGSLAGNVARSLASLVNPATIAATAITAIGAGLLAYYESIQEKIPTVDETIQKHSEILRKIKSAYGDAASGLEEYKKKSDKVYETQIVADYQRSIAALIAETEKLISSTSRTLPALDEMSMRFGDITASGFTAKTGFEAFTEPLMRLQDQLRNGTINITEFRDGVDRIAVQLKSEGSPTAIEYGDKLLDASAKMATLAAQAGITGPAIDVVTGAMQRGQEAAKQFSSAMKAIEGISPEKISPRAQVEKAFKEAEFSAQDETQYRSAVNARNAAIARIEAEEAAKVKPVGGKDNSADKLAREQESITKRLEMLTVGWGTEEEKLAAHLLKNQDLITQARAKEAIDDETHKILMAGAEEEYQKKMENLRMAGINNALTATGEVFSAMGRVVQAGGKKNVRLAKMFGVAEAIIATMVAANKAMAVSATGGPVAAFAAWAAVAAKGLATVAAIRSVSESGGGGSAAGAASGGGGGGGGAAAAGGGGTAGRGPGGNSVYINLQGQSFGRDQVRDLVKQIADFQKDGGQVVFA